MKALILSPHADDGELGCGGTMQKFDEVIHVAFSDCENPELRNEFRRSNELLKNGKFDILYFPVRNFDKHRQAILEAIRTYRTEFPDVVFIPPYDTHQDHEVIHKEAIRAFKGMTPEIYCYELPWNAQKQIYGTFSGISEDMLKRKIGALTRYKTQEMRPYMKPDFIRSLATVRGTQAGLTYAESFEVVRHYL